MVFLIKGIARKPRANLGLKLGLDGAWAGWPKGLIWLVPVP